MNFSTNWEEIDFGLIVDLYDSVGWKVYSSKPEELKRAFENSSYILCILCEGELVGISRSLSDGISIHYLQDILVKPKFQGQGVGNRLLSKVLEHFSSVRTHLLLTDDEKKQKAFYEKLGFSNVGEFGEGSMNSFIKLRALDE